MMYQPREWKIQSRNNQETKEEFGQKGRTGCPQARTAVRERQELGVREENGERKEGKVGVCLDRLNFDLDTESPPNQGLGPLS